MFFLKLSGNSKFLNKFNYYFTSYSKRLRIEKDTAKNQKFSKVLMLEMFFSFILCTVFVAGSKPNAQRNKTGSILNILNSPPINSCVKK